MACGSVKQGLDLTTAHTPRWRVLKTVTLYTALIAMGVQVTLHGTTLLDMGQLLRVDTKTISMVFTAEGLGRLMGSIFCSGLYNRMVGEIQLSAALFIKAALVCALPWQTDFVVYLILISMSGVCTGYFESGDAVYIAKLWKGHHLLDAMFQMAHLVCALAAMSGPFFMQPFLAPACNETLLESTNNTSYLEDIVIYKCEETRVHFVFLIASSLFILPASALFCFYVSEKFSSDVNVAEPLMVVTTKETEYKQKPIRNRYRISLVMMIALFGLLNQWIESSFGAFLYTFVSKGLGWEKSFGARALSLFWAGMCTGRISCVFLSTRLKARTLLIFYMVAVPSAFIILIFVEYNPIILWVGTALLGLALSPAFAATLAWMVRKVKFDGFVSGVFMVGAGTGSMCGPAVTGYLFQEYGHMWMVYSLLIVCPITISVFTVIELVTKFHKRNVDQSSSYGDSDTRETVDSILLEKNANGV